MEEKNEVEIINLREIWQKLWKTKKLFLKVWIITFVLACTWILPQPRTYETSVMLAPETSELVSGGALSDIASSFGINMGGMSSSDAIYPLLYPDLLSSNDFIVGLFTIPVKTIDGDVEADYLTYLTKHQKFSFWKYPVIWMKRLLASLSSEEKGNSVGKANQVNPFMLTKKENEVVKSVRRMIACNVDKKTDVITITVEDQDPLICATMADSVRARLQDFIISYRTSKACIDVDYYARMKAETYSEYQKSVEAYGRFCDTHRGMQLQMMQSRRDELENDMQMKFNTYNVMSTQLDAAKAKVQERTPAFTILQNASVPTKATHPKRMIFVAAMLILATMCTAVYVIRK